ncbi:MAG: LTA synthase family protein [Saccharofermentans sp.]|nr:LTA synthase family protein [Saccharofermentans sp.]
MKEKIKIYFKKALDAILKGDKFLYEKKIYQFVIYGVLIFLFVAFWGSFSSDKVFRNYTEDDIKTFQVSSSTKYQMTFEAKSSELSYLRIYFDSNKSSLSSRDKMKLTLSDEQGFLLAESESYLYNAERGYIRVDMDNVELETGEWYILNMDFTGMEKGSYITLKAHQAFISNSDLQKSADENNEELSLDYSIGFNKVPNISYYFNKTNYISFVIQLVFFLAFAFIIFDDKFLANRKFKEIMRAIMVPVFCYVMVEILNIEKARPFQLFLPFSIKNYFCLLLTLIVVAAFYFMFYMMTGTGFVASVIVTILCAAIGFVNHSKLVMRGDSFMPWDIVSAGIAVKTGSTYYFHVTVNFIAGIAVCVAILCLLRLTITKYVKFTKGRVYLLLTSILSVLFVFTGFVLNPTVLNGMNIYYQVNPPVQSYNENGGILAFLMHLNNIKAHGGENNSPENVSNLIYQYEGIESKMKLDKEINNFDVKPNVICIMSESYTDLRTIRDFKTSEPIMPYYDSLMDESINGRLAVSIFGGGTCNTEFEFLTGYSVANLLPGSSVYTFYVNNGIDALPRIYSENGYRTVALHSFDGDWWDRREKYPMLGFNEFYTRDDFDQSARYVRRYISDMSTFQKITDIYEESDEPLFMFCVTMQNHADFSARYDNMTYDIKITDMADSEGNPYNYAENYISLERESDDALQYLIEYFRNTDEPTIIVLFGDHYPTLDSGFYDALLQTDLGGISVEESLPIYETPYFIWANFDMSEGGTIINTKPGDHGVTSPNFLGQTILDLSGMPSPESRACLRVLQRRISAMNALAVYDKYGTPHFDISDLNQRIIQNLEDYATIQYGLIYYEDYSVEDTEETFANSTEN